MLGVSFDARFAASELGAIEGRIAGMSMEEVERRTFERSGIVVGVGTVTTTNSPRAVVLSAAASRAKFLICIVRCGYFGSTLR